MKKLRKSLKEMSKQLGDSIKESEELRNGGIFKLKDINL